MTDADLLSQYLKGSQPAFTQLVERHINWVYSVARRQSHDAHLAEDITQAVFLLLSQKASRLANSTDLSPWLFQAVRYVSSSALKS